MTQDPHNTRQSQREAVDTIVDAWQKGRGIVPLLGAGISVDAGIPTISQIVLYLAKVQYYIKEKVYKQLPFSDVVLPAEGNALLKQIQSRLNNWGASYASNLTGYIADNGWPELHDLNAQLWHHFQNQVNGTGGPYRQKMADAVYKQLMLELSKREQGLHEQLLQSKPSDESGDERWQLKGNWVSLLGSLTHGNPAYADLFFQRLVLGRLPSSTHRYLAFLTLRMGWRLILTINFDNLLEQALRADGLSPVVYDVTTESTLPHPTLLSNSLSVLKLHGGAYGLRVGESLDYPLDAESEKRIHDYLPHDPLLLVLGFGGAENRMMEVVHSIANHGPSAGGPRVVWLHFEDEPPKQIEKVKEICGGTIQTVKTHDPTAFLAELYMRLAGGHASSSTSYTTYLHRPYGYIISHRHATEIEAARKSQCPVKIFTTIPKNPDEKTSVPNRESSEVLIDWASRYLSRHFTPLRVNMEYIHTVGEFVQTVMDECRKLDLQVPPISLPSHPAPDDECEGMDDRSLDKAVRRICEALRRRRYVLAIDRLASFGRPHTVHHGIPRFITESPGRWRPGAPDVEKILMFLRRLISRAHHIGESVIGIGVDLPVDRHKRQLSTPSRSDSHASLTELKGKVCEFVCDLRGDDQGAAAEEDTVVVYTLGPRCDEPEPVKDSPAITPVHLLSMLRRARSNVLADRLLRYFDAEEADEKPDLKPFVESGQLIDAEGGYYWMMPDVRDRLYEDLSRYTTRELITLLATWPDKDVFCIEADQDHEVLAPLLENDTNAAEYVAKNKDKISMAKGDDSFAEEPLVVHAVLQCALLADRHDKIARYYYSDLFLASRDVYALMEYVYHRISSLRYFTKLSAVVHRVATLLPPRQGENPEATTPSQAEFKNAFLTKLCTYYQPVWRQVIKEYEQEMRSARPEFGKSDGVAEAPAPAPADSSSSQDTSQLSSSVIVEELGRFFVNLTPLSSEPDKALVRCSGSIDVRRRRDLNALITTIKREREYLLTEVPSSKLMGWIDYILSDDIARLFVERFRIVPAKNGFDDQIGEQIVRLCRQLFLELLDLKAKVLLEATDYPRCARLRMLQIMRDLPKGDELRNYGKWSKVSFEYISEEEGLDAHNCTKVCDGPALTEVISKWDPDTGDTRHDLPKYLTDVAVSLYHLGQSDKGEALLLQLLEKLSRDAPKQSGTRRRAHRDRAILKARYRLGALPLAMLNPWTVCDQEAPTLAEKKDIVKKALRHIKVGRDQVRRRLPLREDDYHVYRCLFQTTEARARYIDDPEMCEEAIRLLESAQSGIRPDTGAHRTLLAVRSLVLGESLMLQSRHTRERFEQEQMSSHRESVLLERDADGNLPFAESTVDALCWKLRGSVADQVDHLWRRVREPHGKDQPALSIRTKCAIAFDGLRESAITRMLCLLLPYQSNAHLDDRWNRAFTLGSDKEGDPVTYTPAELFGKRISELVESAKGIDVSPPKDRWEYINGPVDMDSKRLVEIMGRAEPSKVANTHQQMQVQLTRAQTALESAHELLLKARKNLHWWLFYYQLRAQLAIEFLMLRLLDTRSTHEMNADAEWHQISLSSRDALFAIRDGLDTIIRYQQGKVGDAWSDKGTGRRIQKNERWLMQSWFELTVVNAALSTLSAAREADREQYMAPNERLSSFHKQMQGFWRSWQSMNREVGIVKTGDEGSNEDRSLRTLTRMFGAFPVDASVSGLAQGLFIRRFVREWVHIGGINWLRHARDVPDTDENDHVDDT